MITDEELSQEDEMLLAMLLSDLSPHDDGKTRDWLEEQQGLLDTGPANAWIEEHLLKSLPPVLGKVATWLFNRSASADRKRIDHVLAVGVKRGLLTAELRGAETFYRPASEGRIWTEEVYVSLAEQEADRADPEWTAASICCALDKNSGVGTSADLLLRAVFPSLSDTSSLNHGAQKFHAARALILPGMLQEGLDRALENKWIAATDAGWVLTPEGQAGVHYFDHMR